MTKEQLELAIDDVLSECGLSLHDIVEVLTDMRDRYEDAARGEAEVDE